MKRPLLSLGTWLLVALTQSPLWADTPLSLPGSDGEEHQPLVVPDGKKAAVYYFVSPFCNTSNTLIPDYNAVVESFGEDFAFYTVHVEKGVDITMVMQHTESLEVKALGLLDANFALAKKLGATTTPEVVVVDAEGKTLYQGRINDLYLGPTQRQREATQHDLRDALSAIQEGKAPPVEKTEAMGCKISY